MLKSEEASHIPLLRKKSRKKRLIGVQSEPAMCKPYKSIVMWISSRKEARPTGAALRSSTVEIREDYTFSCKSVQIGSLYALPVTSQMTTCVMSDDHQNIRSSHISLLLIRRDNI
jgi:hypothetical protein